jgi:hypothetical protein
MCLCCTWWQFNATLKSLQLRANNVTDAGGVRLAMGLGANRTLTALGLIYNCLGAAAGQALLTAMQQRGAPVAIAVMGTCLPADFERAIRTSSERVDRDRADGDGICVCVFFFFFDFFFSCPSTRSLLSVLGYLWFDQSRGGCIGCVGQSVGQGVARRRPCHSRHTRPRRRCGGGCCCLQSITSPAQRRGQRGVCTPRCGGSSSGGRRGFPRDCAAACGGGGTKTAAGSYDGRL